MDPAKAALGLCATCQYQRTVGGARSIFSLCERSFTDPRFSKYPPLPVVRCGGHVARSLAPPGPPEKM